MKCLGRAREEALRTFLGQVGGSGGWQLSAPCPCNKQGQGKQMVTKATSQTLTVEACENTTGKVTILLCCSHLLHLQPCSILTQSAITTYMEPWKCHVHTSTYTYSYLYNKCPSNNSKSTNRRLRNYCCLLSCSFITRIHYQCRVPG